MIHHASAPCRLDFAGGWSDVAPFATERRGVVVNAAIELRATVEVELGGSGHIIESRDLGISLELRSPADYERGGGLDLLKAALRLSSVGGCRLTTRSDAPPGSGLGSSGALDVALVAALDRATGLLHGPAEIAERAWQLEAIEAGLPGGKQDQYAAALGGFHRLEFTSDLARFEPVTLAAGFADWLERQIVVGYTGQSRVSGDTIARVMAKYARRDPVVTGALEGLVETAERMTLAMSAGDPAEVGRLLSENWRHQQALDPGMRTSVMAKLETIMMAAGAVGGKAAGAGAGGSMFFLIGGDPATATRLARAEGITVLPVAWARDGVRTW